MNLAVVFSAGNYPIDDCLVVFTSPFDDSQEFSWMDVVFLKKVPISTTTIHRVRGKFSPQLGPGLGDDPG